MTVPDVKKKGAGVLRNKPNIYWKKDRGKDVESAPWYPLFKGDRINDHHLTLEEKRRAQLEKNGDRTPLSTLPLGPLLPSRGEGDVTLPWGGVQIEIPTFGVPKSRQALSGWATRSGMNVWYEREVHLRFEEMVVDGPVVRPGYLGLIRK